MENPTTPAGSTPTVPQPPAPPASPAGPDAPAAKGRAWLWLAFVFAGLALAVHVNAWMQIRKGNLTLLSSQAALRVSVVGPLILMLPALLAGLAGLLRSREDAPRERRARLVALCILALLQGALFYAKDLLIDRLSASCEVSIPRE